MPDYDVTTPDGQKLTVTAPEGATEKDVYEQAQKYVNSRPKTAGENQIGTQPASTGSVNGSAGQGVKRQVAVQSPSAASRAWQAANTPLINPSTEVPESITRGMSTPGRVLLGGAQALGEFGKSMTSPFSLLTMGGGGALAKAYPIVSRALSGAFGLMMAKDTAEQVGDLLHLPKDQQTPENITKHIAGIALSGGSAALAGYDAALAQHPEVKASQKPKIKAPPEVKEALAKAAPVIKEAAPVLPRASAEAAKAIVNTPLKHPQVGPPKKFEPITFTKEDLDHIFDLDLDAAAKEAMAKQNQIGTGIPLSKAQRQEMVIPRDKPRVVIPETAAEPERNVTALREIINRNADTIEKVRAIWPEANLNRERARVLLRAAQELKKNESPVVQAPKLVIPEPGTRPAATTAQFLGKEPPQPQKGVIHASEIVPSATLHGDVRPQPVEGERQVPAAQDSGRVQPRPVEPIQPQTQSGATPAPEAGQEGVLLAKPDVEAVKTGSIPAKSPVQAAKTQEPSPPAQEPKGPGLEGGFGAANPREFSEPPTAIQELWQKVTEPFQKAVATASVIAQTKGVKAAMARLKDVGDNTARIFARQQSNDVANPIRRAFGKDAPLAREALSFYVEAGGAEGLPIDQLSKNLSDAIEKMRLSKAAGKKYRDRGIDAAQFALYHMDELKPMAERYAEITSAQVARENSNGVDTLKHPRYVMHLQDLADEHLGAFDRKGGQGEASAFRKNRTHPTFADSISAGVDPVSLDAVDLLERRLSNGERLANSSAWVDTFRNVTDPKTKLPIFEKFHMEQRADGSSYPVPPPGYTLEHLGPHTVAVQKGYEGVATALTDPSAWMRHGAGRFLMQANAFGKSGRLAIDTFHVGRVAMWESAIKAASLKPEAPVPSYRKGQILLDYTETEIRKMADAGEIPKEWVKPIIDAKPAHDLMLKTGFNIGRISDNLHQEWVRSVPLAGRFNRWVFDEFQRGAMSELWQLEFKRLKAARPNLSDEAAALQISKDLNTRMGNMGRQGWFKSRTMQDTARMLALAPQWNEGLIMSEIGALGQAGTAVKEAAQGQRLYSGTLLRSVGGMAAMIFIANQAINYATRGHPTWDNPEEGIGAKLSAWMPDPFGGPGFFLNPLSLPAETAGLLLKRYEKDRNALDPLNDYIRSRMSYAASPASVELTRRDQLGRPIREEDVPKEMARALLPFPIGFDTYLRALTSEGKNQNYAGEFASQLVSRGGLKLDQAPSPSQRMAALARQFDDAKGIRPSAEFYAGDYEPLTHALSIGNMDEAKKQLQILEGKKTKDQIQKHYQQWPTHPLTGSKAREAEFKRSLSPEQLTQYQRAVSDKRAIAQKFRSLHSATR